MKHKLGYDKALELIKQAPEDKKDKIDFSKEILFTSSVINEIDRFEHTEDLMKFFEDNVSQFGYNNASAYQSIHEIWGKIASFDGLAARERTELSVDSLNTDSKKKANHLNPEKKQSIWKIYLQILGFDEEMVKGLNTDRSIKPILKDNKLLHPIAQDCFPDREGIQKILNGTHVSYDCVRKNMIFLVFYKYWVTSALKRKDSSYRAQPGEADRCFNTINKYLLDAGYPKLYLGNPFDWIFMYAMKDEFPLVTFREFMHELFMIKEEELGLI